MRYNLLSLRLFQSTLSARRATINMFYYIYFRTISIHALREESDFLLSVSVLSSSNFNPRSPRGERPSLSIISQNLNNFNPRSPRGERQSTSTLSSHTDKISIHALREESDFDRGEITSGSLISIHALREESDLRTLRASSSHLSFQSTLSARRATYDF